MAEPRNPEPKEGGRESRRRAASAAKPWHAPKLALPAIGRFVEVQLPQFVPGNAQRHEVALSALVELLTARLEKTATEATASPHALDFPLSSRCPRPSQPAQEEASR